MLNDGIGNHFLKNKYRQIAKFGDIGRSLSTQKDGCHRFVINCNFSWFDFVFREWGIKFEKVD